MKINGLDRLRQAYRMGSDDLNEVAKWGAYWGMHALDIEWDPIKSAHRVTARWRDVNGQHCGATREVDDLTLMQVHKPFDVLSVTLDVLSRMKEEDDMKKKRAWKDDDWRRQLEQSNAAKWGNSTNDPTTIYRRMDPRDLLTEDLKDRLARLQSDFEYSEQRVKVLTAELKQAQHDLEAYKRRVDMQSWEPIDGSYPPDMIDGEARFEYDLAKRNNAADQLTKYLEEMVKQAAQYKPVVAVPNTGTPITYGGQQFPADTTYTWWSDSTSASSRSLSLTDLISYNNNITMKEQP